MTAEGAPRARAYGESRRFRGLEKFAIRLRLEAAVAAFERQRRALAREDLSVLELGCGYNGDNLAYLQSCYPRASFLGVDLRVNPELSRGPVRLVAGNMDDWRPPGTFDLVLSLALAEHLVDLPRHFALVADGLAADGIALLTSPQPQAHAVLWMLAVIGVFDKKEIADHKLYLTRAGLQALADAAALELLDYRSFTLRMNQSVWLQKKKAPQRDSQG
jgi:trans-aconitate methyltransferase